MKHQHRYFKWNQNKYHVLKNMLQKIPAVEYT